MMDTWIALARGPLFRFALALCLLVSPPAFAQSPPYSSAAEEGTISTQAQLTLDDLRTFTDVFNQVRRNYVEPVDDKTLLDAAIRGMLSELDPHSAFLGSEKYQDLNDTAQGRYGGIGISVRPEDGFITVDAIINESPADRAGLVGAVRSDRGDALGAQVGRDLPIPHRKSSRSGCASWRRSR